MKIDFLLPLVNDADTRFTQPANTNFKWALLGQVKHGAYSVEYSTDKNDPFSNQRIKLTTNNNETLYAPSFNTISGEINDFKYMQSFDKFLYFRRCVTQGNITSAIQSIHPGDCLAIRAEWKDIPAFNAVTRDITAAAEDIDNNFQIFNYDILNMSYDNNKNYNTEVTFNNFFYVYYNFYGNAFEAECNWIYSPRPGHVYHIYKISTYNKKTSHDTGSNPESGSFNTDGRIFKIFYRYNGKLKERELKTFILDNSSNSIVGNINSNSQNARNYEQDFTFTFNSTGIVQPLNYTYSYARSTGLGFFKLSSVRLDGRKALLEIYDRHPSLNGDLRCRVDQYRNPDGDIAHSFISLVELDLTEIEETNELNLGYAVLYKPISKNKNVQIGFNTFANLDARDLNNSCYLYGCRGYTGERVLLGGTRERYLFGGEIKTRYLLNSNYGQTEATKDDVYVLFKQYERQTVTSSFESTEVNKWTVTIGYTVNNSTDYIIETINDTNSQGSVNAGNGWSYFVGATVDGGTGQYDTHSNYQGNLAVTYDAYTVTPSTSTANFVDETLVTAYHLIKISNTTFAIAESSYDSTLTVTDANATIIYRVYKYDGTLLETKVVSPNQMEHYCKYPYILQDFGNTDYTDFKAGKANEFTTNVANSKYYMLTKKWFGSWNSLSTNGELDGIGQWSGLKDTPVNWT